MPSCTPVGSSTRCEARVGRPLHAVRARLSLTTSTVRLWGTSPTGITDDQGAAAASQCCPVSPPRMDHPVGCATGLRPGAHIPRRRFADLRRDPQQRARGLRCGRCQHLRGAYRPVVGYPPRTSRSRTPNTHRSLALTPERPAHLRRPTCPAPHIAPRTPRRQFRQTTPAADQVGTAGCPWTSRAKFDRRSRCLSCSGSAVGVLPGEPGPHPRARVHMRLGARLQGFRSTRRNLLP